MLNIQYLVLEYSRKTIKYLNLAKRSTACISSINTEIDTLLNFQLIDNHMGFEISFPGVVLLPYSVCIAPTHYRPVMISGLSTLFGSPTGAGIGLAGRWPLGIASFRGVLTVKLR